MLEHTVRLEAKAALAFPLRAEVGVGMHSRRVIPDEERLAAIRVLFLSSLLVRYIYSIPNWAQSLGVGSLAMLIFPSWGGMINGLLTLRGAWDKVREDVMLKFMVVAVTAYGMATFEGPMLP